MKKRRTKYEVKRDRAEGLERRTKGGPPTKNNRISKNAIAKKLMECYGIPSQVARELGCSPANITYRIKNDPDLQAAKELAEEVVKDTIDFNVIKDTIDKVRYGIHKDDWPQIKHILQTKLKDRYGKGSSEGDIGDIQVNIFPVGVVDRLEKAEEVEAEYEDIDEEPNREFIETLQLGENKDKDK